ncbi:MAG: cupin-like domain-containing protein [Candidatus Andeanibacterium colombiense]|uniref:Cupin-like domain-containing protein n=1 Tax=Candidatus Andeanibacterium colombiense TaxID=3121345 RepID=A0AAJ6BLW8_9SPHN|nr:MAG: cupin-like domain-containing protein [Sphingomonadaceae bacterium]
MSDKRAIIAEALLDGADPRERLLAAGASSKTVDYELGRAEKDPLFVAARRLQRQMAKRDWMLRLHGQLAAVRPEGLSVPRIDKIEPARFFAEFYAANRPVVLTGLVDRWPALEKWTLDYLEETVGGAMVELQGERDSAGDYELAKDRHRRSAPMHRLIAAVRGGASNNFYVTAYNDNANKQALAKLWDDLGPVPVLEPRSERDGFFWFGPQGTLTPFHHDLTNNLLVQVMGRKKVQLVPSWEVGRMKNAVHCFSGREPAEWEAGDPTLPPKLECTIGPGDALFLPIGWWHHVEALDVSISMSFTNFAADNDFFSAYPADTRF